MAEPFPRDPSAWRYETVLAACTMVYEPERLEFKQVFKQKVGDGGKFNSQVAKCACAMANTSGGHILFGVSDDRRLPPAARIVGIIGAGDLAKEFGEQIGRVEPSPLFDVAQVALPDGQTAIVLVVSIALSERRPHYFDGSFWKRTSGGTCAKMSLIEVREQMLLGEDRRRKLTLLIFELQDFVETATTAELGGAWSAVKRFDVATPKVLLVDVSALLSADWLRGLLELVRFASEANRRLDMLNADGSRYVTDDQRFWQETVTHLGRIREGAVQAIDAIGRDFPDLVPR